MEAPALYAHAHEVLRKAVGARIVEPKAIRGTDEERSRANALLANLALYHVVDPDRLGSHPKRLPEELRDDELLGQLRDYSTLVDLDSTGAPIERYREVLDTGRLSLALLVRLADIAVTHDAPDVLKAFIYPEGHPLFRHFTTVADAAHALVNDAQAGERIYAPMAEFLGYPQIAGDILKHAFSVRHTKTHDHVLAALKEGETLQRMHATQTLVRSIARVLERVLTGAGFMVEVSIREQKHPGKRMRKIHRILEKRYSNLSENLKSGNLGGVGQYIKNQIDKFDVLSVHDNVALRVVASSIKGTDMGWLERNECLGIMDAAADLVEGVLRLLKVGQGWNHYREFLNKGNGYAAYHFDVQPEATAMVVPFEIQLKTRQWHIMAEQGGAAHHLYLGGDSELTERLKYRYSSILQANGRGRAVEGAGRAPTTPRQTP